MTRTGSGMGWAEDDEVQPGLNWESCCKRIGTRKPFPETSVVAQWLRIHLPMQGTRVRALAQEDPTCHGATKPVGHNY